MPTTLPADVLVIFGITGDLAKKMTFHALYRLEARRRLDCPIVGVAIDEWSLDRLRQHARDSIEATVKAPDDDVLDRLTARLSYVQGDYADPGTFERVADAVGGACGEPRSPVWVNTSTKSVACACSEALWRPSTDTST